MTRGRRSYMRAALMFMCSVFPAISVGATPDCSNTGLRASGVLSVQEVSVVTHGLQSSDPVIVEASYLYSKNSKDISTDERKSASSIIWSQARRLILLGAVDRVDFASGASTYFATRSGRIYITKAPQSSDLLE